MDIIHFLPYLMSAIFHTTLSDLRVHVLCLYISSATSPSKPEEATMTSISTGQRKSRPTSSKRKHLFILFYIIKFTHYFHPLVYSLTKK